MKPLLLALSKRLLLLAFDASVRRALPEIFRRIDSHLPLMTSNNAPPHIVRGVIAQAISTATHRRATADQVAAVISLYDPVAAARSAMEARR